MNLGIKDFFLKRIVDPPLKIPKGSDIFLSETKGYTCGRNNANDIVCESDKISRKHCIFLRYPDYISIIDLKSGNGVYVNGKRIKQCEHIKLNDNDVIGLGTCDQISNDPCKFIYRVHKEITIDVEREFPESHNNNNLETERIEPPRKLFKFSTCEMESLALGISYQALSSPSSSNKHSDGIIKFNINFDVCSLNYQQAKNIIKQPTPLKVSLSEEKVSANTVKDPTPPPQDVDDNVIFIDEVRKDGTQPLTSNINVLSIKKESPTFSKNSKYQENPSALDFTTSSDAYESDINQNESEMRLDRMRLVDYDDSGEDSIENDNYIVQDVNLNDEREGSDSEIEIDTEKELPIEKSLANIWQESSTLVEQDDGWFNLENSIDGEMISNVYEVREDENANQTDCLNQKTKFKRNREKDLPGTTAQKKLTTNIQLNGKFPMVVLERLIINKPRKSNDHVSINVANNQTYVGDKVFISDKKADELLSYILDWCPNDFQVDNPGEQGPFSLGKIILEQISKTYETYEEYCKVLTSRLLFDVSQKIKNATGLVDQKFRFNKCEVVKMSAIKVEIASKNSFLLDFYLSISVSNHSSFKIPAAGDLLCLEILNKNCKLVVFGYTRNVTLIHTKKKGDQLICAVTTKVLNLDIYSSKILDLRIIIGLNMSLNLVEVLSEFKSTPLMPLIIKPDVESYRLTKSKKIPINFQTSEYKQSNAVLCIANAIASQDPKVCVIEGAPGTGKTTIIINTIIKMFQCRSMKKQFSLKILVCAMTKAEVDEIVLRLSAIKQNFDIGGGIKLIRVGHSKAVNKQVMKFSLQNLSERHVDLGLREFFVTKEREALGEREYKEKISILAEEYNALFNPSDAIKRNILETCLRIEKSGQSFTEMNNQEISRLLDYAEQTLLSEANLIISTLSMSLSNKMESVFGKTKEISICIIDEATQIPEIEILKPLTFGVKTLVLLGDRFKSSTFQNIYSGSEIQRLDNSLFSRIKANFDRVPNSPIISLDLQNRINKRV